MIQPTEERKIFGKVSVTAFMPAQGQIYSSEAGGIWSPEQAHSVPIHATQAGGAGNTLTCHSPLYKWEIL